MIKQRDIFGSSQPRSACARKKLIAERQHHGPESSDFLNYGYDYFDNSDYGIGYGGYSYDGRYASSVELIAKEFDLAPGMQILEVGCAKGFILYEFFKQGYHVQGVDLSEYATANTPAEISEKISCASSTDLAFADDSFDFSFSKEMLPHLAEPDIDKAVNELMRVTKGNQIFLEIQVATSDSSSELIRKWDDTHQTIKKPAWWLNKLNQLDFDGTVNFKPLF